MGKANRKPGTMYKLATGKLMLLETGKNGGNGDVFPLLHLWNPQVKGHEHEVSRYGQVTGALYKDHDVNLLDTNSVFH